MQSQTQDRGLAASASTTLFTRHCCAIESTVFVNQYNVNPDGKNAIMPVITRGMNCRILACMGSADGGFNLDCMNMAPPMSSGSTKKGSREDRSLIQSRNGAWRISTLSNKTR